MLCKSQRMREIFALEIYPMALNDMALTDLCFEVLAKPLHSMHPELQTPEQCKSAEPFEEFETCEVEEESRMDTLFPTPVNILINGTEERFDAVHCTTLWGWIPLYAKPSPRMKMPKFLMWLPDSEEPLVLFPNVTASVLREAVDSSFDDTEKIVVIAHGFWQSVKSKDIEGMVSVIRTTNPEATTIIVVDWSHAAFSSANYKHAAGNSFVVARILERFVALILEEAPQMTAERIVFIGFSLGAQLVGESARRLREHGLVIGHLIALDPAAPCFCGNKISPGRADARFVEVLHTDIQDGTKFIGFGCALPGHRSFYIDGGATHPECAPRWYDLLGAVRGACNHSRAPKALINFLKHPELCQITGELCGKDEDPWKGPCSGAKRSFIGPNGVYDEVYEPERIRADGRRNSDTQSVCEES